VNVALPTVVVAVIVVEATVCDVTVYVPIPPVVPESCVPIVPEAPVIVIPVEIAPEIMDETVSVVPDILPTNRAENDDIESGLIIFPLVFLKT
jgi:hypothetical protein